MDRYYSTSIRTLFTASRQSQGNGSTLLDVPFLDHAAASAAPAALAMIMKFYGRQTTVQKLAGEMRVDWMNEISLPHLLVNTARAHGFNATVACGNITRLGEWLAMGIPPLVFPGNAMRNEEESVAVATGISWNQEAVCLHHGTGVHQWVQLPDFVALCGGNTFTAVPVFERFHAACARVHVHGRSQRNESLFLDLDLTPLPAMAA